MSNLGLTAEPTIATRRLFRFSRKASPWDSERPIREELFSVERLEAHARSLAAAQSVASRPSRGLPLSARLADNSAVLLSAYESIVKAIDDARRITPAGEWLVDNFHLVETQIRQISTDLPPGYYRQLPKLVTGPFAGYPRVFGMAWAFVAHTDSSFDADVLVSYVQAYQEVQPLTIGELWAVSITLQIVLIENLRRLARQITSSRDARHEADRLADRLLGVGGRAPEPASAVFAGRGAQPLSEAFAVELVHRLRDQDPQFTPALAWLDERLAKQGLTADSAVREVHRNQGAANVTVRNIVTSLRAIAEVDWQVLFESYCLVDDVLASGCAFHDMDFATRNLYRSAIEGLARRSDHDELRIARLAVAAAHAPHPSSEAREQLRQSDPGYHLLAGGRRDFEASVRCRGFRGWPARVGAKVNFDAYATAIVAVSAIVLAVPLIALASLGLGSVQLALFAVLGAISAIDAGVALVNPGVTLLVRAVPLPGLDLRDGIPKSLRTLVAVPTFLTTPEDIAEQVERLEIHHLASPEGDLHFALLSDWIDADVDGAEGDAELVAIARDGIERLNRRYGPAPAGPRFLLLHRRRVWNQSEGRWIGWERKRGKLHELNRLLRGAKDTTFMDMGGAAPPLPQDVRYVVTLDSDTRLPRDTIRRLIGKMAHPLNRPRLDVERGAIVEGYGVLQPRVTPSLPNGREGSLFQRVFSSSSGIDPYAAAVSDVYQDMFCEGSYAGKGIYDVDAFESALSGRTPDSALLSHDLFEGTFARAGFASDVEVVDDFPSRYDVSARRHHRWARGDWQLLPWIFGFASNGGRASGVRAELPRIGRWKMIDNLRRTLSAPAGVVALAVGWMLPLEPALMWTTFVLATVILPSLIPMISAIPGRRPGVALSGHLRALGEDLRLAVTLSALNITFLADQAWSMGDAIVRTLWRLFVSRRHLLEWTPAAQAAAAKRLDLQGFAVRMSGAFGLTAAALILTLVFGHGGWPIATPFVVLWAISPAVARYASLAPRIDATAKMSEAQSLSLRQIARRTWRFFETFVTADDSMLPPDNFQEDPTSQVAHRTSPTNIGLYLLSVVCARDFGWLGAAQTIDRMEATLATMARMPRFRGHFYNWYDTRDLRALDPRYISSVDSGNLAGHLIAVANACKEWRRSPMTAGSRRAGIADALALTAEHAVDLRVGRRTQTVTPRQLDDSLAALARTLASASPSEDKLATQLSELAVEAAAMVDIASAIALERSDGSGSDLLYWARATLGVIEAHREDHKDSAGRAASREARLLVLEDGFRAMAMAMDFGFLFDRSRQLLSIGFLVSESALDPNCYDLLASEARLASFFAIAKGDLPARHWFRLGRAATPVTLGTALISWSGSMFEYLMPPLVMRAPARSLLEESDRLVVRRQIEYGGELGLPWGISEICLQRPRFGIDLSIFQFRRAWPRTETGAGRE